MTKQEITQTIARRTGVANEVVKLIVDEYADEIINCLAKGETYYQRGFGTFAPVLCKGRTARNISKGITFKIPATCRPKFKPCDYFINRVKN